MNLAWIDDFLNYMQTQRNASPRTISRYQLSLTQAATFFETQEEDLDWDSLQMKHVRKLVVYMMEKQQATATVNNSLAALRSFYKFLQRTECVHHDPARLVKNPKLPKRLPTFVKESEMDRLFAYFPFGEDYLGLRNRTVMLLLYHTGLRAAELLSLTPRNIDLTQQQLWVVGKGNKERIVPFGSELTLALRQFMQLRTLHFSSKKTAQALFLTPTGKAMNYAQLHNVVKTCLSAVTQQKKKSPHVLRHSFATAMLANGAQLEAIKELMGHESVATTAIYTHTTLTDLKDQYTTAHPRFQKTKTED